MLFPAEKTMPLLNASRANNRISGKAFIPAAEKNSLSYRPPCSTFREKPQSMA